MGKIHRERSRDLRNQTHGASQMRKAFFLLAALAMFAGPQVKADAFTNTLNFSMTDSSGNVLAFALGPANVTGIVSNFPGGGPLHPGDIDTIFFGFPPITFNGTPDGFANFLFNVSAYDGSGNLIIEASPSSNLPWNGLAWNAANTPVSGPGFLDSFGPGSYAVTIGSSSGVFTITNAPEPGMFLSTLLGLIGLGVVGSKEQLKSLLLR
jgi:hypothetical protein